MAEIPEIHFDCRYFYGDRPCEPNKKYGVFCPGCSYYEKDGSIKEDFPLVPDAEPMTADEGEKKIIIVKLDAVGDVLRTTSILPTLKEMFPDSYVTWITKERSYDVLKDNDLIDEIYFTSDELENIYADNYDIAINLDSGTDSCAIMNNLSANLSYGYRLANGKPYPINSFGWEWYLMGVDDNVKKANTKTYHEIIHEICGLEYNGSEPNIVMTHKKRLRAEELAKKYDTNKFEELILINLGGGNRWQYKKWTKEGYTELINMISSAHPAKGVGVIGGEEEKDFYDEVIKGINPADNIIKFGCSNTTDDFICIVFLFDKIFTS
ncbi:MAG: hypothetical protein K8I03_00495, partial [Ignavibacteria bacterium]|nr:hypothetical protein [Ignavibacteria bacterium]